MQAHFVVLPPADISVKASELAKKYAAKFPHWFVVHGKKLLPHITLFTLKIGQNDLRKVGKIALAVARKQTPILLSISRHSYSKNYGGGWVGLKVKDTKELSHLRKELFRVLKKFDLSGTKLKHFSPHITLTKFKNHPHAKMATKGAKISIRGFKANTLAIGLDKKYWQVYKIIKQFKLK